MLAARESLRTATAVALGSGTLKREAAQSAWRELEDQAGITTGSDGSRSTRTTRIARSVFRERKGAGMTPPLRQTVVPSTTAPGCSSPPR